MRLLLVAATVVLIIPFILGAIRIARALGVALAAEALPAPAGGARELDLAAAPRRALLVTLQIAILLVAGVPVVALTQPFLPGLPGMTILLVGVALLVIPLWRSATNLRRSRARGGAGDPGGAGRPERLADDDRPRTRRRRCCPASATPRRSRSPAGSPAVGRTLKQINLRGLTGATVIAIDRDSADVIYPTGDEELRVGDALILTGTNEAVQAAQALLTRAGHCRTPLAGEGTRA